MQERKVETYLAYYIIMLILHLSVCDVRESGRSQEAIQPELKTFLSPHRWIWTIHD